MCPSWFLFLVLSLVFVSPRALVAQQKLELKIMSYNILHGTNQQNHDALTSQAQAINEAGPDLVGLQEVDDRCARSGKVDQMKVLAEKTRLHPAYAPHFDYQGGAYGLGLLSRYPLTNVKNHRITLFNKGTTETRALLSATATLDDGTTVILATVHMGLNQESRVIQAREILEFLDHGNTPVILTGDFNAEPGTAEILLLESQFKNIGGHHEHTYPVGAPVKTIDYIMVKAADTVSKDYRVMTDVLHSDHYPIIGNISFNRN